jgi:glycosyltransferase involved in cell wall biosynthesis
MNPSQYVDSPLSIGYYAPNWPLGASPNGVLTYISFLSEQLRAMGHQTTILADAVAEGDHDPGVYNLQEVRTTIARNPVNRIMYGVWRKLAAHPANSHLYRRALVTTFHRAIAEHGLDILEMEETFGWARWLRQTSPIPICIRLHGPWFLNGRALGVPEDEGFRRRVEEEGRAIRDADVITAPSRDVLEQTRAFYGLELDDAEVIPVPAPRMTNHWNLNDADPKRILFVGRFDRHKGGDLIIDAFGRVLAQVPDARLWFVGPDRGYIDANGRTWHIEEYLRDRLPGALELKQVEWLGAQPFSALASLRRKALVSVVCSRYENVPFVVLETIALGCPLVAARVGGIPEVLDGHTNGLLHRASDSEDLAVQIITLLNDPERAAQLGKQAAIDSQQRFSLEFVAERTLNCYGKAIERTRSRK